MVVLTPAGHAVHRNDPYLTMPAVTPAPATPAVTAATKPKPKPKAKERTVRTELVRLRNSRAITQTQYRLYNGSFSAALASEKRLRGTRKTELEAVVENLHNIAASGGLWPTRLPALFETLDRNRQWWTTGPILAYGQRVEFSGSQLVWQYYPGQGIELQDLRGGRTLGRRLGGRSPSAWRRAASPLSPSALPARPPVAPVRLPVRRWPAGSALLPQRHVHAVRRCHAVATACPSRPAAPLPGPA